MTRTCTIINGHLHSPFFLFLRASGRLADIDLLRLLGLHNFVGCPLRVDHNAPHLYLTEDEAWIHIADDLRYSLWHKGAFNIADALHKALPAAPLFACSVGDVDRSFQFAYYLSGLMTRLYVVDDRPGNRGDRIVIADDGEPLPGEMALGFIEDEQEYVLSLAAGLGVRLDHHLDQIRCYTKPPSQT